MQPAPAIRLLARTSGASLRTGRAARPQPSQVIALSTFCAEVSLGHEHEALELHCSRR